MTLITLYLSHISQSLSTSNKETECIDKEILEHVENEGIKHVMSDRTLGGDSLALDIRSYPCTKMGEKEAGCVTVEYIEKLILLASNARSWHSQEDETVDLTEPRFESFCMSNVNA